MLIDQISRRLFLPATFIENLAAGASHHYKSYSIPKKNGERRLIEQPSKQLKAVQRWLAANVIYHFPVHQAAMAYRTRVNIADNARRHVQSNYLLRVDLHDFFHSLTAADVTALLENAIRFVPGSAGWSKDDTDAFVSFVCKASRLTIGAPTSPPLCNALCYHLDVQLTALADANELVYSRYADDLMFSSLARERLRNIADDVTGVLAELKFPRDLRINTAKTWHSSRRGHRKITGVVLTSGGKLSVGRPLKRRLRSEVFRWYKLDAPTKAWLAGMLAHVRSIEPEFINSLIMKYGADRVLAAMKPLATG